ncbi:unnamed protein product [Linum tenue]|uniref:Uncharacterized protein n=1 Tax=Linum tenue TaxID=586396 RepID=A0AAV0JBF4_9ROSI|nr:unnamed protein product [Linum tenue]
MWRGFRRPRAEAPCLTKTSAKPPWWFFLSLEYDRRESVPCFVEGETTLLTRPDPSLTWKEIASFLVGEAYALLCSGR